MKHLLPLVALVLALATHAAEVKRTEDVIYARKFGTALTFDVFQPETPNGAAVIYMVSGGWYSSHDAINRRSYQPFLDRGYTVFAVVHGSQPRFIIPEAMADVHRAVRYIRHHAARWGVDTNKFAVSGASAGGHLSLVLGTQGGPGKPDAKDPVDRASSAVQAVACFFPPTDFRNWARPGDDAVGVGTLKSFQPAFGPRTTNDESRASYNREIAPFHHLRSNMPPTLITHGDADKLVPIYQAETFVKHAQELGNTARLIVKPGKEHGWGGMDKDIEVFAQWFDEHLLGKK